MNTGSENLMVILFVAFCLAAGIQLFYYLWFYLAIHIHRPGQKNERKLPVSVIICAKNESENLARFLPSVLTQVYPEFEVIVVNDCSEDRTDDVLGELLLKFPVLKVSSINKDPKFAHGKKFAQFIGIKAASYDYLVFTDADCEPESEHWLEKMASGFTEGTDFVLGYGGYFQANGLLNRYIRYETMFIAMQYLGMAIRGIPYMGVGRNMAYRKEVFFRNRGYGAHNHIISGDDDLFVNSNATGANTKVEFSEGSATRSVAAKTLIDWIKQKHRHLSTSRYYATGDKLLLAGEQFSRLVFYVLFVFLMTLTWHWPVIASVFGIRLAVQVTVNELVRRKLREKKFLLNSLIFDIFSPLINLFLYFGAFRFRPDKGSWK
jgi:cellulose synthase/poly-beta-1,6-N-acetylglucosamine synthase-like glycosyltransferase